MRTTRGKKTLEELRLEAWSHGLRYLIVVGERRGNPSQIRIYHVGDPTQHEGPRLLITVKLLGIKLSREIAEAMRTYGIETVSVDIHGCVRNDCFELGDFLLTVYGRYMSNNPDIRYVLKDTDNYTLFMGYNRFNKPIGPVIRVSRVVIHEAGEYL